ncbi:hypothetical protein TDB9533_03311 [Thalassocella blandensis]|nr:hypothetical protein TDB9533_03311 [Thalassocella blandensis]
MAHTLSIAGAVHTAISLVPIAVGIYCFCRYTVINPNTRIGWIYLASLVLSVLTSFSVSSTGSLNPAHVFGVIVLGVAFAGVFVLRFSFLGKARPYLSAFALTFSFFLSLVPGTNETLTRLPVSHPVAEAPMAPVILSTLMVLFALFVAGYIAQCWFIYGNAKKRVSI